MTINIESFESWGYSMEDRPSLLSQIDAELRKLEDREIASFDSDGIDYERYLALQDERNRLLLAEQPR